MIMECDRKGCQNILCDRLSDRYGYICDECFDEMVATRLTDVAIFMRSKKPYLGPTREMYEQIFSYHC